MLHLYIATAEVIHTNRHNYASVSPYAAFRIGGTIASASCERRTTRFGTPVRLRRSECSSSSKYGGGIWKFRSKIQVRIDPTMAHHWLMSPDPSKKEKGSLAVQSTLRSRMVGFAQTAR